MDSHDNSLAPALARCCSNTIATAEHGPDLVPEGGHALGARQLGNHPQHKRSRFTLNNYSSHFARLLIDKHPVLDEVFDTRVSPADAWIKTRNSA